MYKPFLLLAALAVSQLGFAQPGAPAADTSWKKIIRGSTPRINNLVHTKLDVRFDYAKAWLYGKEWLTLKPHFYATDSVLLDAKGMEIKEVAMVKGTAKTPLKYEYNGMELRIKLDRSYKNNESYTLYFDYISKPNELKAEGSAAITDAKGLYFINPTGEQKDKPIQIWTQGETEANSAWMITIDKPNQKTTQELSMTVPDKYVSLSNGLLTGSKKNTDGTRTDTWKMDLPHAPYLFFMGVGDFAIIKDAPYKGKEISYYVEKDQAPYAKKVFGNTPEMVKFFSEKLGVDYPWSKYAQMVGRDYVSGAMENTTATLHQESAYQNSRQLVDGNAWEETIAHELFHQWFGDLVTAESWTNITVNESFANYSEYIWDEYKYSKDHADAHHFTDMQGYLMSGSEQKDLVRLRYSNKEDVFDAVSYNKGGRILHMLRNYVGDEAFFKSLNLYLTNNKFKTGEAGQLRLAFEEVTGQDLFWFWDQWYYGSGHPKLKINYNLDVPGQATVIIEQTQKSGKVFKLPIDIDVYSGNQRTRYPVVIDQKTDSFTFPLTGNLELINVDAEKILLAEKTDNKSEAMYVAQWKNARNYLDRKEALDFFAKKNMPELANGLRDKYYKLRVSAIQKLAASPYKTDKVVLEDVEAMATKDRNSLVRAAAISFLAKNGDAKYKTVFEKSVSDSSYSVAGEALKGLANLDPANAYTLAKQYSSDAKGTLGDVVNSTLMTQGTEADFAFLSKRYADAPLSEEKLNLTSQYADYLAKLTDNAKIKKGIDDMMTFRNGIPSQFRSFVDPAFEKAFQKISKARGAEIEQYVQSVFK